MAAFRTLSRALPRVQLVEGNSQLRGVLPRPRRCTVGAQCPGVALQSGSAQACGRRAQGGCGATAAPFRPKPPADGIARAQPRLE
eukprot:CAMPEP_0179176060 /NCGR_PEP_ID=MMETSP0796-20121207/87015_1 /TAXON_ID=73915 /ORGANISM="Pyrodinium bahamense, Strain pbaha01" /LENGTH=84 /DNA_ID=CAMNT_0020879519 /DNA_START=32 /DNA_END=286 /DNA_ORIENTATION=-